MIGARAIACVCAVLAFAGTALAQDDEARSLYQRGENAYVEGRYEAALAMFEEAYSLSARPQLLYNLANTLERLGRVAEAIAKLREFLPHAPDSLRSVVERRIQALEEREARRAQEQSDREAAEAQANAQPTPTPTPPPSAGASIPWGPIILYGVAGIAGGIGIGTGVMTLQASSQVSQMCETGMSGVVCPRGAAGSLDQARTLGLATDILLAVSAAAFVAGTIWLIVELTSPAPTEHATATRLQLALLPTGVAARLDF
jgi:tetratricopeptide (TPR) repeat protein